MQSTAAVKCSLGAHNKRRARPNQESQSQDDNSPRPAKRVRFEEQNDIDPKDNQSTNAKSISENTDANTKNETSADHEESASGQVNNTSMQERSSGYAVTQSQVEYIARQYQSTTAIKTTNETIRPTQRTVSNSTNFPLQPHH